MHRLIELLLIHLLRFCGFLLQRLHFKPVVENIMRHSKHYPMGYRLTLQSKSNVGNRYRLTELSAQTRVSPLYLSLSFGWRGVKPEKLSNCCLCNIFQPSSHASQPPSWLLGEFGGSRLECYGLAVFSVPSEATHISWGQRSAGK
ncbi:MAG: hypothetical protein AOA65_1396 [Candidatus Bathyarchaeota archaeon BA1]|nr:MAG: hypothetical protein AOA65_1396 [Candidatus Bathyarchaeota archaeon BA1]